MTHLVIQQKKVSEGGSRESVTSAFIKKLYDYTNDANLVYQSTDLKGDLSVDKTYQDYIDYLTTKYPGLDIQATSTYIYFGDDAVESYWANTAYGDGIGITSASAATITQISNSPFQNNTSIVNLNGMQYFINCTNINGKFAENATSLTSFTSPQSLIYLSVPNQNDNVGYNGTFMGCSSLSSVTLNEGLQKIGCRAFYQCTSLQTIDIPSTVTVLTSDGSDASWGAFQFCSNLATITGGEGITKIGADTFNSCQNLQYINDIDLSQLTYLGNGAFYDCQKLELGSISLPNITSIKHGTFDNCKKLTSINIPNVTTINTDNSSNGAFYSCSALTTVTGSNIQTIGYMSFRYCTSLSTIDLSHATYIGSCAFQFCESLTTIDLSSCTTLQESAFNSCTGLTTVNNSSNLTTLNGGAFYGCSSLSTIDFSNVTKFGGACFQGCSSLGVGQDLDMDLDGKQFGSNAFRGTGYRSITLHETTKHYIFDFPGNDQYGAFGYNMPNMIKLDLSDTKQTNCDPLFSNNVTTVILPETYTGGLGKGRGWSNSILYVICLQTNASSVPLFDSYWGFQGTPNNYAIYVPDSSYNDYVDRFITNSNDPIPSNRLKKISELPASVTWYTKEHPST